AALLRDVRTGRQRNHRSEASPGQRRLDALLGALLRVREQGVMRVEVRVPRRHRLLTDGVTEKRGAHREAVAEAPENRREPVWVAVPRARVRESCAGVDGIDDALRLRKRGLTVRAREDVDALVGPHRRPLREQGPHGRPERTLYLARLRVAQPQRSLTFA